MTKSLYAVLNVAPDADPAVIEAAYKALMKKYHPDRLGGAAAGDERRAAEINEAFQVLRDAERRARYDQDARVRTEQLRRTAYGSPPPIYAAPPPPARRSRWPRLLLLLLLGGTIYYFWQETDGFRYPLVSANPFSGEATAAAGQKAPVRIADVERAVATFGEIKKKSGLMGLSAFSQDCFAIQTRSMRLTDLDFCVAFDHASAAYGARIAGDDLPQLPRFQPAEIDIRHQSAARLVSTDDQWINARLMQLRSMTAEQLNPGAAAPAVAGNVALAPAAAAAAGAAALRPKARAQRPTPAYVPRRYRAPQQQVRRPVRRAPARETDFLEREGYIY